MTVLRPAGAPDGGTTAIRAELYEVGPKLLARLDRHEAVPWVYVRKTVVIASGEAGIEGYVLV